MGSIQSTHHQHHHRKLFRAPSSTKLHDKTKYKRTDRFRTTMRSVTLRALANRNCQNSLTSLYDSTMNNSSYTSPTTITTTTNSQLNSEPYLSDFDYKKLSTLTGLAETKINELHREFLMLSNNGRLTYDKYRSMLEIIPNEKTSIQLDKLARQTFTLFDKDGNNYLDFAEFIAAYIIMEKNELFSNKKIQSKEAPIPTPTLASVTRQATKTYYSPQRTLVNQSSPSTYRSSYYYQPYHPYSHSSERYIYPSSQYNTIR